MKKLFLVLALVIIFINLVGAVKETQILDNGCSIEAPVAESIMIEETIKSHLHVVNTTTGSNNSLTNDTTECYIHVYNDVGSHIIEQNYSWDSNDLEWVTTLEGGNFSTKGLYSFYVQCTSLDSICFVRGSVMANSVGDTLDEAQAILSVGLLAIMVLIMFGTFFAIGLLPDKNTQDEEGRILSVSYLKYLRSTLWFVEWMLFIAITFISANVALAYLPADLISGTLFMIFRIAFGLTPLIVIIWVISFFVNIFHDKQIKNLLDRGMFPGSDM